jgi:hypothetical protein
MNLAADLAIGTSAGTYRQIYGHYDCFTRNYSIKQMSDTAKTVLMCSLVAKNHLVADT